MNSEDNKNLVPRPTGEHRLIKARNKYTRKTQYRIWLHELDELPSAWYSNDTVGCNAPIQCRTFDKEQARLMSKQEAIATIRRFRGKGYPCNAVPKIYEEY